jgi:cytochrome c-type biogenesis protein CcmH/NrfF
MLWLLLAASTVVLTTAPANAQSNAAADEKTADARVRALVGRLHAPCCRHLMLEGHESELTRELRHELRTRFVNGESEQSIEADLRKRYGDSIVAVPRDRDPRPLLSWTLAGLVLGALAVLAVAGRRWVRRTQARQASSDEAQPISAGAQAELDARLDRELRGQDI